MLPREMMIVAHQKQIEELRESFRQKSSDTEQWSQKVICAPSSGASAFLCIQSMCNYMCSSLCNFVCQFLLISVVR